MNVIEINLARSFSKIVGLLKYQVKIFVLNIMGCIGIFTDRKSYSLKNFLPGIRGMFRVKM